MYARPIRNYELNVIDNWKKFQVKSKSLSIWRIQILRTCQRTKAPSVTELGPLAFILCTFSITWYTCTGKSTTVVGSAGKLGGALCPSRYISMRQEVQFWIPTTYLQSPLQPTKELDPVSAGRQVSKVFGSTKERFLTIGAPGASPYGRPCMSNKFFSKTRQRVDVCIHTYK